MPVACCPRKNNRTHEVLIINLNHEMTMPKQVNHAAPEAATPTSNVPQNLFISVRTFDGATGKTVGERIVDMCHYGTRNWLSNHLWWSTHNGHCVEVDIAKPGEIEAYLEAGKVALAAKFNAEQPAVELAPVQAAA